MCFEAGSPFHSAEFCSLIQHYWPGASQPRHVARYDRGRCQSLIPGYLYGHCPRLDYYRGNVVPRLQDRMIGAHALVGWYGGPVAQDDASMKQAVADHLELCRRDQCVSLLFGIDGRDRNTLQQLEAAGYYVGRLQSNAVLQISPAHAADPLAGIKKKTERSERRRVMRRAEESGLELRIIRPADAVSHVELIRSAVNRLALDEDILPASFVHAALLSKSSRPRSASRRHARRQGCRHQSKPGVARRLLSLAGGK